MKKIKILLWGDAPAPLCYTGYGTVVKNIFGPLHETGKFDIDQIAINYHGDFYDKKDCPWQLSPARLLNPNDPYGTQMLLNAVSKKDYDLIWMINDSFILAKATDTLRKIINDKKNAGRLIPKIVAYYPIDCRLKPEHTSMIEYADAPIAYAKFGYNETVKILPTLKNKLRIIHHGADTSKYFPYSKEIITKLKKQFFNLEETDFLIANVNRNTKRKQLWRTLETLVEFRKEVPNSYLYLHTNPVDKDVNLLDCIEQLNLKLNKDVFFPPNYSPSQGYPDEVLNQLVNCADVALNVSLGEGWGLGDTMAMACGVPFIGPDDTVRPEIFGNDRGYLYPTKEYDWIDLSGLRPKGHISDIVNELKKVHSDGWKHKNLKVIKARKWIEANDWSIINKQWMMLFDEILVENNLSNMIIGDAL